MTKSGSWPTVKTEGVYYSWLTTRLCRVYFREEKSPEAMLRAKITLRNYVSLSRGFSASSKSASKAAATI